MRAPQRVRLETPSARWRRRFLAAAHRSRALHHPWVEAPSTAREFSAYVRRTRDPDHYGFLVVDDASGELAGVVNLNNVVRGALQGAALGYYAFAPYDGAGFMSAGLSLAVTRAFRRLKLHRLEANIQPENARSIALVQQLGFRREGLSPRYLKIGGRWRDHERWAVLADEWRAVSGRRRGR